MRTDPGMRCYKSFRIIYHTEKVTAWKCKYDHLLWKAIEEIFFSSKEKTIMKSKDLSGMNVWNYTAMLVEFSINDQEDGFK